MANEVRELPLFPLGTVLFPGMSLPLQLFEPRYLQMLEDISRTDSCFGVALIKEGQEVGAPAVSFEIGTVAQIVQREDTQDGRVLVLAVGGDRFRSLEVLQDRPYITARVELLPADGPEPSDAEGRVREKFLAYARLVAGAGDEWVREVRFPERPAELSYLVAQSLDVSMAVKQGLLEMDTPHERLQAEAEILDMATEHLRRRVRQDGPSQRFSAN